MTLPVTIGKDGLIVREAGLTDLEVILHHRLSMFRDMGYRNEDDLTAMLSTSRPFFEKRLSDGRYHAWLVETSSHQVVAGGGIVVSEHHSSPTDPSPERPVIVNVYTEPLYRRRGIARGLIEIMIHWCREQGFRTVTLHASAAGRPLYEDLGFQPTNEMRLKLFAP